MTGGKTRRCADRYIPRTPCIETRTYILWSMLPDMGHAVSLSSCRSLRCAKLIPDVARARAAVGGMHAVESRQGDHFWGRRVSKRPGHQPGRMPQLSRWCNLGMRASAGVPSSLCTRMLCRFDALDGRMLECCRCGVPAAEHGTGHSEGGNRAAVLHRERPAPFEVGGRLRGTCNLPILLLDSWTALVRR